MAVDLKHVQDAIHQAVLKVVNDTAEYALKSAKEDAPVRQVFKTGKGRRNPRRRGLTSGEVLAERMIRTQLATLTSLRRRVPLRTIGTVGRLNPANPALPFAAPRRSYANVYAPFPGTRRRPALTPEEARRYNIPRPITEIVPTTGRETARTPSGGVYLTNPVARSALSARGRFELSAAGRNRVNRAGHPVGAIYLGETGYTLGGRLRGEIHLEKTAVEGSRIKAEVVSPVYYSKYQEFGTRHNRAHPYMRPAIAKLQITYRQRMLTGLKRALSKGIHGTVSFHEEG